MRNIRVATASFLMEDEPHTIELNLERAAGYVRDAAKAGAQIVCLPETVTTNGLKDFDPSMIDSEPWEKHFAKLAKEYSIAVIAPFYVREGEAIYNQASVFAADGSVAGYYRKAQPTGWEARFISLGNDFPIIDLGFAKVAIMICMDIYFAEIPRIYAMKGAELLFWPTVAHGPTQSGLEAQIRTRAMDNSLYVIESNLAGHPPYAPYEGRFYPGTARVVDPNGDIITQTGRRAGLAIANIDLDERRKTSHCVLINEPDDTRADLEALTRMDLYAREYRSIAEKQTRYYDSLHNA